MIFLLPNCSGNNSVGLVVCILINGGAVFFRAKNTNFKYTFPNPVTKILIKFSRIFYN